MKINESNRVNVRTERAGMVQEMDAESKEFQNQIASAQN